MTRATYNRAAETAAQRRAQARAYAALQTRLAARAAAAERRYVQATRHAAKAARDLHDITRSVGRPCPHCAGEVTR